MGKCICHKDGVFFEWSTVVDAPISNGMNEKELRIYHKNIYGDLPIEKRIERAIRKGTSMVDFVKLEDFVSGNRAGPYETEITLDEIMQQLHVREKSDGTL